MQGEGVIPEFREAPARQDGDIRRECRSSGAWARPWQIEDFDVSPLIWSHLEFNLHAVPFEREGNASTVDEDRANGGWVRFILCQTETSSVFVRILQSEISRKELDIDQVMRGVLPDATARELR